MKELVKSAILDFQERLPLVGIKRRDLNIEMNSELIITLIGPRRCGKTCYFYSLINELVQSGVDRTQILYFNFEDERLSFSDSNLHLLLESFYELFPASVGKELYLFFDEIQEVHNWEKFVRRINDMASTRIFITGSSAKLLSKEIATSLRGRSITYNILPLSFNEYCRFLDIDVIDQFSTRQKALLQATFVAYLIEGGFPDTVEKKEDIQLKIWQSYFDVMIYRDIVERYAVSNTVALKRFLKQLAGTLTSEFSINKIYNDMKSSGVQVSKDNLYLFLEYAQDCFLYFLHYPLEFSERKSAKANKKLYFVDNGLLSAITFNFSANYGKLLENCVFLELVRREKEIYFSRNGQECDFVVQEKGEITQLIQVCYNLSDGDTRERELKVMNHLAKKYPRAEMLIITSDHQEDIVVKNGVIKVKPAWKWMLDSK